MSKPRFDKRLVSLTAPNSFAAEQYQGLRLTVERLGRSQDARIVAVTSPGSGEGKTLTTINLAAALARGADGRVLLVDADLRRPSIASVLRLTDADVGLADVLSNPGIELSDVVRSFGPFNLSVVPAGTPRRSISEILRSPRLETFLQQARRAYDFVVLDTPPLLAVVDSALLAKWVDGVLMVVAAGQTPRRLLAEALNMLDRSKVIGLVFNRDERPLFGYYDSYYREYFPDASQVATEA